MYLRIFIVLVFLIVFIITLNWSGLIILDGVVPLAEYLPVYSPDENVDEDAENEESWLSWIQSFFTSPDNDEESPPPEALGDDSLIDTTTQSNVDELNVPTWCMGVRDTNGRVLTSQNCETEISDDVEKIIKMQKGDLKVEKPTYSADGSCGEQSSYDEDCVIGVDELVEPYQQDGEPVILDSTITDLYPIRQTVKTGVAQYVPHYKELIDEIVEYYFNNERGSDEMEETVYWKQELRERIIKHVELL